MKANRPNTLFSALLSFVVFFSTFGGTSADIIAQDQVYTLTVTLESGFPVWGGVTSDPPGINCNQAGSGENVCSYAFPANVLVRLYAWTDYGFIFTGWSGDCSGRSTCEVLMNNNRNVGAAFRDKNWYVYPDSLYGYSLFGGEGDIPVPADYNGDGRDEIAVFRPSQSAWYIVGKDPFLFGGVGDILVVADYNGDGRDDVAIFREDYSGNNHGIAWQRWYISGVGAFSFGLWRPGNIPVPADYNGDGRDDIAFFWP